MMSTLFKIIRRALDGVLSLLIPARCAVCGAPLMDYEHFICVDCSVTMPRTLFHTMPNNPMAERMHSLIPTSREAASLFYFHDKSQWRDFIHRIKYHGAWRDGAKMGYLYGLELSREPRFCSIDVVVPVPLHPLRRIKRGYNQSEYIAQGVASALGVKLSRHALRRIRNNPSQTKHNSEERWVNVDGLFSLRRRAIANGAHILLVDDLFTTGATITACADAICAQLPNATISVVTLALSARHFSFKA